MYKISEVKIDQFWQRCSVSGGFRDDVNIIIGKNGSGKTTFMNILFSILAVDVEGLYDHEFETAELILKCGKKKKTIKARKIDRDDIPYLYVEYQISNRKYRVRCFGSDDRVPSHYRRKAFEDSIEIRTELSELVSLASLSVYRIRNDTELEVRDRGGRRMMAPVDMRLDELMRKLTRYQLELSQHARAISSQLQKDVLISLLYKKENKEKTGFALDFDKQQEKSGLISAYQQLGVMDAEVRKRINVHVDSIDKTATQIKKSIADDSTKEAIDVDFAPLEAFKRTRSIVEMSLVAEKQTEEIFSQVNEFIGIAKEFITDKSFRFSGGDLVVENEGAIPYAKLSSGEKQLLILLTEALLQKQEPYIYLADEPEISLHIAWQKMVIPAIRRLNPNAQIIVATHSPEIAGNFSDSIIDMEDMIYD